MPKSPFHDSDPRKAGPKIENKAEDLGTPVASSPALRLLPFVLSVIAGCTDVISFIGLAGLFTAHITGNFVILAAHLVIGAPAQLALVLSVPVFVAALALARLLVAGLQSIGLASLLPMLLLQLLLLAGCFVICVAVTRIDPQSASGILAGMLGVSAMAVQNALVQVSLKGAPSTAVMTTNVTRFTMDVGEMLLGRNQHEVAKSRRRATRTLPAIIGSTIGCALGAACQAAFGLWSLALPVGLALLAIAMASVR